MISKALVFSCLVVIGMSTISYMINNVGHNQDSTVVLRYTARRRRSATDSTSSTGETSSKDSSSDSATTLDSIIDTDSNSDSMNSKKDIDLSTATDETSSGDSNSEEVTNQKDLTLPPEHVTIAARNSDSDEGQTDNSQSQINEDLSESSNDGALSNSDDSASQALEDCRNAGLTNCTVDNHKYYEAVYIQDNSLWIELCPEEGSTISSIKHAELSNTTEKLGYMTDAHLNLTSYLFYGLPLDTVSILTGGFLHVGPTYFDSAHMTNIIKNANYISPFMGNFAPGQSNESNVYYFSNETVFIVQWDKMQLENRPENGNFTFQVQLHSNNDIVFAYKELPIVVLPNDEHGALVGISDAYHMTEKENSDWVMINVYHELVVNKTKIGSHTAVKFEHQLLCMMLDNCYDCTTTNLPDFQCRWCSKLNKCADIEGDRNIQEWHEAGCSVTSTKPGTKCDEYCYFPPSPTNTTYTPSPGGERPIMDANENGTSSVKVECDDGYSVSNNYHISAADIYQCTAGGIDVPSCRKSCEYTTAPTNGILQGIDIGHSIRPDASFPVYCDPGHRLRSQTIKEVRCIEGGILDPDPANIRCEKFCTLPHQPFAFYMPEPDDQGILHEGESTKMMCKPNHILYEYVHGTYPNSTVLMTCTEGANLTALLRECVGYCSFLASHPNTTYTPLVPMIGDMITITCANGTALKNPDQQFRCSEPELLDLPTCVYEEVTKTRNSSTANSLKILLAIFICTVVCIVGAWVLYAYRHPTSPSGLFLIEKCRPWTWRSRSRYSRHHDSLADSYYMDGGI